MKKTNLSMFEGYGVEIEYMLVDAATLAVKPIADVLLSTDAGPQNELVHGDMAWSNELVAHVVELKTQAPASSLAGLSEVFGNNVTRINQALLPHGAKLMPTAMHPFMNPKRDMRLWPHGDVAIYDKFNEIFDCRGHGWSNLQSTHLNLPFANDDEFGRLHAAIRMLLPLLPALCASSPMVEGRANGTLCNRMQVYRQNAQRIPSVAGLVIPEGGYTRKDYEILILARIYQDLAPFDIEGTLQHEWVNARGVIPRFDRHSLEIRVLDVQECPMADLSVMQAIVAVLRALVGERWSSQAEQRRLPTRLLANLLRAAIVEGPKARLDDASMLSALGYPQTGAVTLGEVWQHLIEAVAPVGAQTPAPWRPAVSVILERGTLAQRILHALGRDLSREHQRDIYGQLCTCLADNVQFVG